MTTSVDEVAARWTPASWMSNVPAAPRANGTDATGATGGIGAMPGWWSAEAALAAPVSSTGASSAPSPIASTFLSVRSPCAMAASLTLEVRRAAADVDARGVRGRVDETWMRLDEAREDGGPVR